MLIVGSVLNLINQGEALFAPFDLWNFLLTDLVPFSLATYGAASALAD